MSKMAGDERVEKRRTILRLVGAGLLGLAGFSLFPPTEAASKKAAPQGAFTAFARNVSGMSAGDLTRYAVLFGDTWDTVESNTQFPMPVAVTLRNLKVYVGWNGLNGAARVTLRKNGVDQSLIVAIPAGQIGIFSDMANSVSLAVDDLVNWKMTTAGTTGSITILSIGAQIA